MQPALTINSLISAQFQLICVTIYISHTLHPSQVQIFFWEIYLQALITYLFNNRTIRVHYDGMITELRLILVQVYNKLHWNL